VANADITVKMVVPTLGSLLSSVMAGVVVVALVVVMVVAVAGGVVMLPYRCFVLSSYFHVTRAASLAVVAVVAALDMVCRAVACAGGYNS
jgi:hypothetical protein